MTSVTARRPLARLLRDRGGVAMIELAYGLPIFLAMALPGIEVAHFITTKMRMSQVALHIADHAARMGNGSLLAEKVITETDINDILTGAGMQSAELDIYKNGRVILSSVEPVANPNPTNRFKITWQRCRGTKPRNSSFGTPASTTANPVSGVGPTGRQIGAPQGNATMFVEVYYEYQPLIGGSYTPWQTLTETAAMVVRERRDLDSINNDANAPVSRC